MGTSPTLRQFFLRVYSLDPPSPKRQSRAPSSKGAPCSLNSFPLPLCPVALMNLPLFHRADFLLRVISFDLPLSTFGATHTQRQDRIYENLCVADHSVQTSPLHASRPQVTHENTVSPFERSYCSRKRHLRGRESRDHPQGGESQVEHPYPHPTGSAYQELPRPLIPPT